jgi:histidine phosphotransfer protein HptB
MIDWKRVQDLRDEIGEDDFLEVVAMFLEETDEVVACLVAAPSPESIEGRLHFLKGSALNLGLAELAALCQIGEKTAALGNAALVDLDTVIASYTSSRAQFLESLGQSKAA